MSIELGTETKEIKKEDRTWRVEIFCEHNKPYVVNVHRETLYTDADGNVMKTERGVVTTRTLQNLMNDPEAVMIANKIKSTADKWRQEDLDAEEVTPEFPNGL